MAVGFAAVGEPSAWRASVAWWPVSATLTNLINIGWLHHLSRREGLRWSQLLHADFRRERLGKDLLALLGLILLIVPAAMIPNLGLGTLLFGNPEAPLAIFVQPLPAWVALACLILLPITQTFGELPTYFGYALPRLKARWGSPWKAIVFCAFWLGAQHIALPLVPDIRFILWRLGMFIPFALLVG